MKAKVQRISFPKGRRVIAVSDIHGCCDMLEGLLRKISFSGDDILVLVGDVFEKGVQNLALLRYLTALSRHHTVLKVIGNCDIVYEDLLEAFTRENGETLMSYMLREDRSESLPRQMSREIGFPVSADMDLEGWRRALLAHFPEELEFLRGWPHILESEKLIFVHAGLTSACLEEQQAWECRKNDDFMSQGLSFSKMCVVGHWPTENYPSAGRLDQNPRLSREMNICSIDGGCMVKRNGQLNALILPDGDPDQASWEYFDLFPRVTALDAQEASENPRSIIWGAGRQWVEKLEEKDEFTLCRQELTGAQFWVMNRDLYYAGGHDCAGSATDYRLAVQPGEALSLLRETSRGYLVKKDGITGWYLGSIK